MNGNREHKFSIIFLALAIFLFLDLGAVASSRTSEEDLYLLTESIKNRESTYSSVTDHFDFDIFTDTSIERLEQYENLEGTHREEQIKQLFANQTEHLYLVSSEKDNLVLELAVEQNLFYTSDDDFLYENTTTSNEGVSIPVIIGISVGACFLAFFVSIKWNKEKRKRKAKNGGNH